MDRGEGPGRVEGDLWRSRMGRGTNGEVQHGTGTLD